jgi:hypothetical protein
MKTIEKILEWTGKKKKEFRQSLSNGEGGYSSWELLDELEVFIYIEIKKEKPKEVFLRFHGIDYANRPVFKEVDKNNFYGSITKIYPWNDDGVSLTSDIKSKDLVYFGNIFGCEPMGNPCPDNEKWVILKRI